MRRAIPRTERGAALLAVLALVVLLAGFASLGLERLKAASERITDTEARSEAQLLASAGTDAALATVARLKARAQIQPGLLDQPLAFRLADGTVEARLSDAGNCFNLNSLGRPPARDGQGDAPAAARPEDFARLLAAAGIPLAEATGLARATADRLSATGQLWADASEWVTVPGVTQRHWDLAGPLLCALPSREANSLNVNRLTADKAPLLVELGFGSDQARRLLAGRPQAGWATAADFLGSEAAAAGGNGPPTGSDRVGVGSRWMALDIVASTPRVTIGRDLVVDTLQTPAVVVSSRWRALEVPA